MKVPRRRGIPLSWKLIGAGLLVVGSTVTVGVQMSITDQRRLLGAALVRKGESLTRTSAILCLEALLARDYPVFDTFVENLIQDDQDVVEVRVRRDDGEILAEQARAGREPERSRWHIASITLDDEVLGRVELHLSHDGIEPALRAQMRSLVLVGGLFLLVGGSLLVLLVRRLLGVPLEALDAHTRRLSRGELEAPVEVRARGELARLASTLEELRVNVRQARGDLEGRNAELVRVGGEKDRALRELEQALEATRTAERAKAEFLANMSHELRTPLNGVLGMSELLRGEGLEGEAGEWVEAVHGSALDLNRRIGGLFDWLALEKDALQVERVEFDFEELITETVEAHRERAAEKDLQLDYDLGTTLPGRVLGDAARLRQVLDQLVDNAIKFTDKGGVRLRAHWTQGDEILIEVADSGPGVDLDQLGQLFEPFHQADGSTTRRHGGTGLGLAIARRLVELMGGSLGARSPRSGGAVFEVRVPLPPVAKGRRSEDGGCGALRVLVVDDNPVNLRLATVIVKRGGHRPVQAPDGRQAVDRYREEPVDLVLMDCQMPVMDGFEATRRIRELEEREGRRRVPVVALTAGAFEGGERRCRDAGMDGYLSKPIDPERLLACIEAWGLRRGSVA